mmetsp:Transcript_21404/g.48309  ORF Transcript_21404/g.48309 Transcript_21404/m.48309 type:complete len:228 (-) Transcript_21404:472-1155(-)
MGVLVGFHLEEHPDKVAQELERAPAVFGELAGSKATYVLRPDGHEQQREALLGRVHHPALRHLLEERPRGLSRDLLRQRLRPAVAKGRGLGAQDAPGGGLGRQEEPEARAAAARLAAVHVCEDVHVREQRVEHPAGAVNAAVRNLGRHLGGVGDPAHTLHQSSVRPVDRPHRAHRWALELDASPAERPRPAALNVDRQKRRGLRIRTHPELSKHRKRNLFDGINRGI